MKSTLKRFLSLLLCMCMSLTMLPSAMTVTALAATSGDVTGLSNENIGLSFTGSADNAWSASGTSITGSVVSVGGTCSDTSYNSTLTIKNNKDTKATLSFDYAIEQNSGTITVDKDAVTAGGTFSKEVAAGETVEVYIKSGSTTATKITMTNVALVSDVTATTTFVPAENGTYTVDGKAVTEEYSNTQSSMTSYQVVATPAEGYQFLGWYNLTTGECIATAANAALNIESDCTVTAKFANKSLALFETGGQRFDDLNEAVSYAQANSQTKITLATDGSISGTYTIPAGITLLIPFDEAGTLYTNAPAAIRTTPASKPFRTLTMSEGTSITVNGAISLGGRYFAAAGSQQGRPVGDYGYIKMADDSSITVKKGGNLYAWGFISGSGSILAESGATVYEFYQIADFRGGSASSGMGNKVFPFSQYFVQNIEVPLTLNAGANEKVFSGVYAMSTTYTTAINFIGDTGMFKVESGSFTKDYDEGTDRLVLTVNGEAVLNTLSLKLANMSVNSANYVLPITNNITINIQSGNVTINQDTALLAGVEVNVAEGAGLTVADGKSVYFYDSDEWNSDNFVWGSCKFKSVAYAPGKAYNRTNSDLVDAKMDVNGSVTAIGAIYTTEGGADICSSNGTGKYIQQGAPGTEIETYQYNANGNNAVTIPITAAKLHNADDTYTETATASAGDVINYIDGVWGIEEPGSVTITWIVDGVETTEVCAKGETPSYTGEPTKAEDKHYTYTFAGWDKELTTANEDTTYTAQFTATGKNGLCDEEDGTYWLENGEHAAFPGLVRINKGTEEQPHYHYYYFGEDGKAVKNGDYKVEKNNGLPLPCYQYRFGENGIIVHDEDTSKNGICEGDGSKFNYIDGIKIGEGLIRVDGKYYYARTSTGEIIMNREYGVTKTNGLPVAPGLYHFDADGVMQIDGFVTVDDDTYYYANGTMAKGFTEIDGDYYFFNLNSGKMCKDVNLWVAAKGGMYYFDADGKMQQVNGFVTVGGYTYYYDNGELAKGFTKIDGDYYFFNAGSGKMYKDAPLWVGDNAYGVEAGMYYFDADGVMQQKEGFVIVGDDTYYYDNGKPVKGFTEIDGDYYFFNKGSGKMYKDATLWVGDNAYGIEAGMYYFDADGKMTNN